MTPRHAHALAAVVGLLITRGLALAQAPIIQSFHGNGQLAWTNLSTNAEYRVDWTSDLNRPWRSSWNSLSSIHPSTQTTFGVEVPMFFRVSMNPVDVTGIWDVFDGEEPEGQMLLTQYNTNVVGRLVNSPDGEFNLVGGTVSNTLTLQILLPDCTPWTEFVGTVTVHSIVGTWHDPEGTGTWSAVYQSDVSGVWDVFDGEQPGGNLLLQQSRTNLTGMLLGSSDGDFRLQGLVSNSAVSFNIILTNCTAWTSFNGTVTRNRMGGTWQDPEGTGTWSAVRH
jgi:hypothetical protein